MSHSLPPLPYPQHALEPHISGDALSLHYGKHHQTYVDNLNKLVDNTTLARASLEDLIGETYGQADKVAVFNNAAQVWNHTFFWHSMKPTGGGDPPQQDVKSLLEQAFGSVADFKDQFKQAAVSQFASGWAWLVWGQDGLKITKSSNADTPLAHQEKALLTCDVWEHAYYLDYQNRRAEYVEVFLNHLINWDFLAQNLAKV